MILYPTQTTCRITSFAMAILCVVVAPGQDTDPKQLAKETLKLTDAQAAAYRMVHRGSREKLSLVKNPVLAWSNPTAGEIYGHVYLWTRKGRPEIVGSLYKWYSPHTHSSCELQSLSQSQFDVTTTHHISWHPRLPGLEFQNVLGAGQPADSATGRLLQMRKVMRSLSVRKTDREGVQRQLRMLARPIYRYGDETPDVIDGALFVFVQGTDPEVWALIEAVKEDGKTRWKMGFARMNSVQFIVTQNQKEIWRGDILPWSQVKDRNQPYTTYRSNSSRDSGGA